MTVSPPATPFGLRVRAALMRHGMLGLFPYADVQLLKGLADGPALRQFLDDRGWIGLGPSQETGVLDRALGWISDQLDWQVAPAPLDPHAELAPDDAALDVALADIARQAQERSQFC